MLDSNPKIALVTSITLASVDQGAMSEILCDALTGIIYAPPCYLQNMQQQQQ